MRASRFPAGQRLASECKFVDYGRVNGSLYDFGKWPGYLPSPGSSDQVFGELYLLPKLNEVPQWVDLYEGIHPNQPTPEYRRVSIDVFTESNKTFLAWIYAYQRTIKGGAYIRSGRWGKRFNDFSHTPIIASPWHQPTAADQSYINPR